MCVQVGHFLFISRALIFSTYYVPGTYIISIILRAFIRARNIITFSCSSFSVPFISSLCSLFMRRVRWAHLLLIIENVKRTCEVNYKRMQWVRELTEHVNETHSWWFIFTYHEGERNELKRFIIEFTFPLLVSYNSIHHATFIILFEVNVYFTHYIIKSFTCVLTL